MNNKSKSILALLGTLFIGMILGALFTGLIVRSKMKGFHDPDERLKHRKNMFYDFTDANSEQKVKIDEVLDKNSIRIIEIESDFKNKRRETMDLIVKELEPVLNEEQIEILREKLSKARPGRRRGFRK